MRICALMPLALTLVAAGPASKPAATSQPSTRPATRPREMSEAQRREAWEDMFRASRRATFEADQAFPAFGPRGRGGSGADLKKYADLKNRLEKKYTAAAVAKHDLTEAEAARINAEWIEKKWPAPKDAPYAGK